MRLIRRIPGLLLILLLSFAVLSSCFPEDDELQYQYDLALQYADQGMYTEAIQAFTDTITMAPGWALPYAERGDIHALLGDAGETDMNHYGLAISDYLASLGLDDRQTEIYLKAARVYMSMGMEDRAVSLLNTGIEVTEEDSLREMLASIEAGTYQSGSEKDLPDEAETAGDSNVAGESGEEGNPAPEGSSLDP